MAWEKGISFLQRNSYPLTVFVVLFILFFKVYSYTQGQPSGFIYWFDDWIFYADSSGSYDHMKKISFKGNMWRHPLYPLLISPLTSGIKTLSGFGSRQAANVVIALIASLNISLFFMLFHSCFREKISVLLFTGLYGVFFSNLVFFSIPETYSLANAGILVFFLMAVRFRQDLTQKRAMLLGLASGLGALINPPLGLLIFSVYVWCGYRLDFRQSVRRCLRATLAAGLVYVGVNFLLFGFDYIEKTAGLTDRWATVSNYLEAENWLNVGISFFLYAVVSPLEELERSIRLSDISGYFRSPVRFMVVSVFVCYLGFSLIRMLRRNTHDLMLMAAVWLASLSLFHVYFNPREALLYSSQVLAPFMLILGRVFEDITWRWKTAALGIFSMGLAYVNITCLMG